MTDATIDTGFLTFGCDYEFGGLSINILRGFFDADVTDWGVGAGGELFTVTFYKNVGGVSVEFTVGIGLEYGLCLGDDVKCQNFFSYGNMIIIGGRVRPRY